MLPLAPNPKTGFLESNRGVSFDSALKVRFLEMATEAADAKLMPDIPGLCKTVGISTHTFWEHKKLDDKFRTAWESVLDTCESTLTQAMYSFGQRPGNYMDRITWLRAHKPERWNPDYNVKISHDSSGLKESFNVASAAIEAEIVEQAPVNPVISPSDAPK